MGNGQVRRRRASGEVDRFDIVFSGAGKSVELRSDQIEAQVLKPLDDRLIDFMEIAAAIFVADTSFTRGGDTQPQHGAAWRRDLGLRIAVRDLAFWSRADVTRALIDAVEFMTDDSLTIDWQHDNAQRASADYFDFGPGHLPPLQADEVVMYSGGLDSVAGIIEMLETTDKRLVLITHRSAPKLVPSQRRIFDALKRDYGSRLIWVPVTVTRAGMKSRETTQRSRSLLFTALGVAVAHSLGARGITFFENGIVSHNLPVTTQVVGTLATRTTHPNSIRLLRALACLVTERDFPIANPFQWQTKAEVVERFRTHHKEQLIAETISCNQVRDRGAEDPQCGGCSQCLDRTFALAAAGLSAHDPVDRYAVAPLTGQHEAWRPRTMALEWTRHAISLSRDTDRDFMNRFVGEVTRVADGYPDQSISEVFLQTFRLHQRHGQSVLAALTVLFKQHAADLAGDRLPGGCLIRMIAAGEAQAALAGRAGPPALETAPGYRDLGDSLSVDLAGPLQVEFRSPMHIKVRYLLDLTDTRARVVSSLKPGFDADRSARCPPERHRYCKAARMADDLKISEPLVRQSLSRIWTDLAEAFELVTGKSPPDRLLVQNRKRHGYRLDPTILVIDLNGER